MTVGRVRIVVVLSLITVLIASGAAVYAITQLSSNQYERCLDGRQGRAVLRKLIIKSTSAQIVPSGSPELRHLIRVANRRGEEFQKYALDNLPLPDCTKV